MPVLTGIDIIGIQSYIFATQRLVDGGARHKSWFAGPVGIDG
jgi:hypothetical protein